MPGLRPPRALTFILSTALLVLTLLGLLRGLLPPPQNTRAGDTTNVAANSAGRDERAALDNSEAVAARARQDYGKLPLSFEANEGQTDPRVKFISRGGGYTLFLTPTEAVLRLRIAESKTDGETGRRGDGEESAARSSVNKSLSQAGTSSSKSGVANPKSKIQNPKSAILRMSLVGANAKAAVAGLDEQPGKSNYFIGNDPRKWRANVSNYSRVRYEEIYPGVALEYYGNQRQLEYDFRLAPGASLDRIRLAFKGANGVRVDEATGDLLLETAGGELRQHKPFVYQETGGGRKAIEGRYILLKSPRGKRRTPDARLQTPNSFVVGFDVAQYDASLPLVIDPVLSYSTFLGGGSNNEVGLGIAVDGFGNAYVTGFTDSADFPLSNPFDNSLGGGLDVFVSKLNATGTALVYSTYLGGSGGGTQEQGKSIAVDASGQAYVVGTTDSTDFPLVNQFQGDQPLDDAFLAKLNATGTALLYSTYLGGNSDERGMDVALDSAENAYVAGDTFSADFPTQNAFDSTLNGNADIFVTKINTRSSGAGSLVYSTYLGGTSLDTDVEIAVDFAGSAYVAGATFSTDFPTLNAADATLDAEDGFVTKFVPAGNALVYSTYLGGNNNDGARGIAVDSSGNAYVTSFTGSFSFPVTGGAFQSTMNGSSDAAVTKFTPSGAIAYSTFLGGSGQETSFSIAVDSHGNAVVAGITDSTDFPTQNASQPSIAGPAGNAEAFVAKLNRDGTALVYSTYLGGSISGDIANGVALDSSGNAYVAGSTGSTDFPVTSGAFQTTIGGTQDAFVTKLSQFGSCSAPSYTASTGSPFAVGATGPASVAVGDFNGDGKQDLVTANKDSDNASVLLGDGTGSFGTASNFGVNSQPFSVAVGDFNLDGKQDLAVANRGSNNVSILLGDGAGSFGAATNFGVGSSPRSIAVGDFNHDGKPDLATANDSSNNVSILLGNGTGGFGAVTNFTVGTRPFSVAIGDFNRDGNQDLATANFTSNDVSIVLGNGAGGFGAATNFSVGAITESVAVGDFDGDGKQDVAAALINTNNVAVLFGDGAGSFGAALNVPVGDAPTLVIVGDFNGDSKQDIATANQNGNNVSVVPGNGGGGFGTVNNFSAGALTFSVTAGDFNGDTRPDLAASNLNSNNVSVLLSGCGLPNAANTIAVNTVADTDDGACTAPGTGNGCTLREAINAANANAGTDTITFNIPGAGVHTISPTSALPTITNPIIIDGYTQPGASANTLAVGDDAVLQIELDGTSAGASTNGLNITAGNSTVRGLVINRFNGNGINMATAGSNLVTGCYIGANAAGTAGLNNHQNGIRLAGSGSNTIGGAAASARNVISGNDNHGVLLQSPANVLQGNYIGPGAAGSTNGIGNFSRGVSIESGDANTIGGTTAGAGNVISGNANEGIVISSDSNIIQGNLIGPDAAGTAAVLSGGSANSGGISISGNNNIIGGTTAAARNIISGNDNIGIGLLAGTGNTIAGNYIGTRADGVSALPNIISGIEVGGGSNNTIGGTSAGAGNRIAFNADDGVSLFAGTGINILGNSIHDNGTTAQHLGIDLIGSNGVDPNDAGDADTGPNNLQNFPVVTSATVFGANTRVMGTLNSTASTSFRLEFFANAACDAAGNGEGQQFLGSTSVVTDASGNASFTVMLTGEVAVGTSITATATDAAGNTSEFSACSTASPVTSCGSTNFAAATNFITNPSPNSVAVADFNGDSKADWAVPILGFDTVTVFLGNGAGGISSAANFPAGTFPSAVAVGDFNGDGKLDLAVANQGSNNVSILLGSGAGTFGAATNFTVGNTPVALAVADFNGDGNLDIAAANNISNNVSILLGNGAGSFGAATNFAASNRPRGVAVGDFNGDGKQDLAVVNTNSKDVSVLLGDGAGSFGAATNFTVGDDPVALAVADFNGDGKQDIVAANQSNASVSVLLGNGAGSFGAATNFSAGFAPFSVAVGDFDGDGDLDLAVANASTDSVSVLTGDGAGAFAAPVAFTVGDQPVAVASGDFNGDGKPDLTTADSNSNTISVLLNNCTPPATAYVVNVASDGADNNPGDNVCNDGTGNCSLRAAIQESNAHAGADTINFNIPGAGVHTISPTSPLPDITDPVIIDGYTQPGSSANTQAAGSDAVLLIELAGTNAGSTANGLNITAGNSTVRGLVVNRFRRRQIRLLTGGSNTVAGNFVCTNTAGTASAGGNVASGIFVENSSTNTIGGTTPGDRNVVSGCDGGDSVVIAFNGSNGNVVRGNFIGTNAAGTNAVPGCCPGLTVNGPNTVIGGTTAGARNLISGNGNEGIVLASSGGVGASGSVVQGNFIGTDVTGTLPLGNGQNGGGSGVFVTGVSNVTIGGTAAGEGNVIAFNVTAFGAGGSGVEVIGSSTLGVNILGNAIFSNGGLGINLRPTGEGNNLVTPNDTGDGDTGPNNLQNFPVLTSATTGGVNTTVQGTLNSTASTNNFRIEFFSSPSCDPSGNGEGRTFLGSTTVNTDASGNATINVVLPVAVTLGEVVTATATDPSNNTSEFSACVTVSSGSNNIAWKNPVTGNWSDASKWEDGAGVNRVPTAGDNVTIAGRGQYTVFLDVNASVNSITVGTSVGQGLQVLSNANGQTLSIASASAVKPTGVFQMSGGVLNGGGSLDIESGAEFSVNDNAVSFGQITFNNSGKFFWTSVGAINNLGGVVFNNQSNGLFEIQNDQTFGVGGATAVQFTNAGTLRKTESDGTSVFDNVTFSNSGTITVDGGGTLKFNNGITQTAGNITVEQGNTLDVPGGTLTLSGGVLRGGGTVNGNVNNTSGTVSPGLSPGCLDIAGNYIQGAAGTLNIEVGGATACTQFDRINISGTATLDGTLNATLINSFDTGVGSSFQVMAFASRTGTFSTVNGPFTLNFSPTALNIVKAPNASQTFNVTNTNDAGAGSLRQAILDANANTGATDTIAFNIAGAGPHTITPTSALPIITDAVVIDGYTQPGSSVNTSATGTNAVLLIEIDGSGGGGSGLRIDTSGDNSTIRGLVINRGSNCISLSTGADNNTIEGNFLGTDPTGTIDLGSSGTNVSIFSGSNNTIGGTTLAARNIISGSSDSGVQFLGSATGNVVAGNLIGTDKTGTANLGNATSGVLVDFGASGNRIGGTTAGAANTIAFNGFSGVNISSGTGSAVLSNSIHSNGTTNLHLGIDLGGDGVTANDAGDADTGPNDLQNFPALTSATTAGGNTLVQGTLNSTANTTFRVEFFSNASCDASGNGEGRTFLGFKNVTTDASGNASVNTVLPVAVTAGEVVTATATDAANNTSEFSQCVAVAPATSVNWTGAVSTDWHNGANWDIGFVPGASDAVVIPSAGVTNEPAISSADASASTVTVQAGRTLTVTANRLLTATTLTVDAAATLSVPSGQTGNVNANVALNGLLAGGDANSLFVTDGASFANNGTVAIATFRFRGTSQTLSGAGGYSGTTVEIINGASLSLASNHTLAALSISNGTFDQGASFNLSANSIVVSSLGTFRNVGTGDLTLGAGGLANGGTVTINGGGAACGDADSILIRSSAAGAQRAWTGAGAFTLTDVDVKDQAGTAAIAVHDGTNSGNNGANWTFTTCAGAALTFTVNSANDNDDGACDVAHCSLREAINAANANVGFTDTIAFQIAGAGTHTIAPASALPVITDPVIINGYTQPGASANTSLFGFANNAVILIELNGAGAGAGASGLNITAGSSTVRGLAINRFAGDGVRLTGAGANNVAGCFIGTNPAGTAALANTGTGVGVFGSSNNTIGGSAASSFNVISGNTGGGVHISGAAAAANTVRGNLIGTRSNGFAAIPNGSDGVLIDSGAPANTVGGPNIISGNAGDGVEINASAANNVQGNFIGVDRFGGTSIPNTGNGVRLEQAANNTVNGGNTIAGSGQNGIFINGAGATANVVQGNFIGTNNNGGPGIGNTGDGVRITGSNNTVGGVNAGEGNSIRNNGGDGVSVVSGTGNAVLRNSATNNSGLGIDLNDDGVTANDLGDADAGANNSQNFPVLNSAASNGANTFVQGALNSTASTTFRVEFFSSPSCDASGNGEGQTFLGFANVTTDVGGNATFNVALPNLALGTVVTATATDPSNNTSEFSACRTVVAATFSISGRVLDANGQPMLGINVNLAGSTNADTTTDPAGNYAFTNLPQGGNFTLTPFEINFRFNPVSRQVNNLQADAGGVDFTGRLVNHTITGIITDPQGNPIPGVTVTLAGAQSSVTTTNQQGAFTFQNVPTNGSFVITPDLEGTEFSPRNLVINGISNDANFNSTGTPQPSPTPTPDISDEFNGGPSPDPDKWAIGILTNPPPAFDPLVRVFLQGGLLHIVPRKNANGPSYSGLVSVRAIDFDSTPIISVEVVQAAQGEGTQTLFGLGANSDNWFRFAVQNTGEAPPPPPQPTPSPNATPSPSPTPNASPTPNQPASAKTSKSSKSAKTTTGNDQTGQSLLFELNIAGNKTSVAIPYDPAQHRFWRFRHDAPARLIIFETSPDAATWTERFRAALPANQTQLIAELSAGSFRPSPNPIEALFDNFLVSPSPRMQFTLSSFSAREDGQAAQVDVIRTGSDESPVSVDFATSDGTAHSGSDYTSVSGRLLFGIGERRKTISVPLINDDAREDNETFKVTLSNPVGGRLGSIPLTTVTILDDDNPANPIDDTAFFVRQHYLDFLGREPDQAGLQFWINNIESCGQNLQCRDVKRVDTSAAFFLSIEFQETGYFVHRFYKATFGRPPAFAEYLPDLTVVREGVIIGEPGALERLALNKRLFAEQWTTRTEFKQKFGPLNEMQYVDTLAANAGIMLTEEQRTALIVGLLTKRTTRGEVLQKIVENEVFTRREFNPAFVRMEYFGYLRRDPDAAGFEFWLSKLNSFNGDFRRSEMVKAFLTSIEYRSRFGQP